MKSQTKNSSKKVNLVFLLILGITASVANNVFMQLPINLYLDTIFTVAVTFLGGVFPGFICAVLTTAIYGNIYHLIEGAPYDLLWYLYIFCSIAIVLLVRLFAWLFPDECKKVRIDEDRLSSDHDPDKFQFFRLFTMLIILSLTVSILISVVGGLISAVIDMVSNTVPEDIPPETWLQMGFIRQGFSLTGSKILGRIPVNMADKSISVFVGFGIAFLVKSFFTQLNQKKEAPPAAE